MDVGRRRANARAAVLADSDRARRAALPPGQRLVTDFLAPAAPRPDADAGAAAAAGDAAALARRREQVQARVRAAADEAVAHMWALLVDFAEGGEAPRELLRRAPADHPVLRPAPGGRRLRVVRGAAAAAA